MINLKIENYGEWQDFSEILINSNFKTNSPIDMENIIFPIYLSLDFEIGEYTLIEFEKIESKETIFTIDSFIEKFLQKEETDDFRYILFNYEINNESLKQFIEEINGYNGLYDNRKIIINMTTPGGDLCCTNVMIEIINTNNKIHSVNFYGNNDSGGFLIMSRIKKPFKIMESSASIVHFATIALFTRDILKNDYYTRILKSETDKINGKLLKEFKELGFTENQLKIVESGRDLLLTETDLRRLFNK